MNMSRMRRVNLLGRKVMFEVFGSNLRNLKIRVSSKSEGYFEVDLDAESLLYLLDELRFIVESVISELE